MQKTYDAILILGTSVDQDDFSDRVKDGVDLYKKKIAPKIIFSGRYWGGLSKKLRTTEAKEMARYAKTLGIPKKDICLEENSLNTIGNFYFVKKQILEPQHITSLVVITKKEHLPKARFLAKKVLGPSYSLAWRTKGTRDKKENLKHISMRSIAHFFKKIDDGDDDAVKELLLAHPYYKGFKV